jgi:hypothetical protein
MLAGLVAALLAACSSTTTPSPAQTGVPGASGAAGACPSAPDVSQNLPADWKSPGTAPQIIPTVLANPGELTCGKNRFIFLFTDPSLNVLSSPDRTASVKFYDLGRDPKTPMASVAATFVWAIQDQRGDYIADVSFTEAGLYGAEFTTAVPGGQPSVIRLTFPVDSSSPTVRVGQPAPSTKTPTASDAAGIAQISTDSSPDAALYRTSEDQALAKHDPFAIVFATPKFCTSAQCGPTLDRIKPFVAKYPSIDFIHVEPYQLQFKNGQLQAVLDANQNLVSTDVTNAWGLTGEPWVFTVDRTGIITGSFEIIFSDAELTAALDAIK